MAHSYKLNSSDFYRHAFFTLSVFLILSTVLTFLFLFIAVEAASKKERAEGLYAAYSAEVGSLESTYLKLSRGLTLEGATALGLKEDNSPPVVYVGSSGVSLGRVR